MADADLGPTQGLDGYWFQLPLNEEGVSTLGGHLATLTMTNSAWAIAWFYDSGCSLVSSAAGGYTMVNHAQSTQKGLIPASGEWVYVHNQLGAASHFVFSVE